jgi:Protein of unknown function (DUF1565)
MKRRTIVAGLLPLVALLVREVANATDHANYYVSANGSDRGRGTKFSPWRTLNKALATVPANRGRTIHLDRGTFDLGGEVAVPSGVRLIGAGMNATTVIGTLRLKQVKNVTIAHLKLEGKNYTHNKGMVIRDADRLRLHDLAFNGYKAQAFGIERARDGEIYNITITDCSYNHHKAGGGGKQSATVSVGNLTNFALYNFTIDTRARGGAGIVSHSDAWNPEKPWVGASSVLRNVKFYHLEIKVDRWHAWGNGSTPQLALELWHQTCHDCEILNSTFNSTISLVTQNSTRIRVHHNLWNGSENPYYACEADSDNLEFDHNYIRNGYYPLAVLEMPVKTWMSIIIYSRTQQRQR